MADDQLSQAELESLQSRSPPAAKRTAAAPQPRRTPAGSPVPANSSAPPPVALPPGVQLHDFSRPRLADVEQLRSLAALHAPFARDLGAALSAMLRSVVEVKLNSVDELAYRDFMGGLASPTCLSVLRAPPLAGSLALEVCPSILYPMIDRLLGGAGKPGPLARRPLTDIELRLASRITAVIFDKLAKTWRNVAELSISVERVESDPHAGRIVLPHEAVLRVGFELTVLGARGPLALCLPLGALRSIAGRLSEDPSAALRRPTISETNAPLSDSVRQSAVELVVHLAETRVAASELLKLRVGDILTTNQPLGGSLSVSVGGTPKFRAQPGAFQGHKAVRIDEALSPPASKPLP